MNHKLLVVLGSGGHLPHGYTTTCSEIQPAANNGRVVWSTGIIDVYCCNVFTGQVDVLVVEMYSSGKGLFLISKG